MNTTSATKPDREAEAETAWYVYGVVPASASQPARTVGVGSPPAPVELVRRGEVAALVSEVDTGSALGTPEDLRAHARVLDAVAANSTPVLPFRFGGVVRDKQAVADELLAPAEQNLLGALEALGDLAQFTVRGGYRQDRILREILDQRPDIAGLREQIKDLPADAALPLRMQLGELVSQELDARRQADGQALLDTLAPLATATVSGTPDDEQAVDASFLVHPAERADFEAAAEDLAQAWAERIDLRLLGPLAPYDFAAGLMEQAEQAGPSGHSERAG